MNKHASPKRFAAKHLVLSAQLLVLIAAAVFTFTFRQTFIEPERLGLAGFTPVNYSNPILSNQTFSAQITPLNSSAYELRILLVAPYQPDGQPVTLTLTCADSQTPVIQRVLTEQELFSNEYLTIPLPDDFEQGHPCTVRLQSDEQDPDRAVRVLFGTAGQSDVAAWYCDQMPQPDTPAVMLVYESLRRLPFALAVLMFGCMLFALGWHFAKPHLPTALVSAADRLLQAGYALVLPFITIWCIELLQFGNLQALGLPAIAGNVVLIWGLTTVLFAVTLRPVLAAVLANLSALILGLVNHYLLIFRGTVLLPFDILGAATAAQVVSGYTFEVDIGVTCAVLITAASLCMLALDHPFLPPGPGAFGRKWRLPLRIAALGMGLVMTAAPIRAPQRFGAQLDQFRQPLASRLQNGFLLNFSINVPLLAHHAPDGYDAANLTGYLPAQTAASPADNAAQTARQLPNLLFVMNESFCDPRTLFTVNESEAVLLPGLDALKTNPAAQVGQLGISIFGGGTSCTEYEMLTGFAIRNDSANYAPYMTYFNRNTPTLAWYLRGLGYETAGLHLASSRNWYRDEAYPAAGLNRLIFQNEITAQVTDSAGILTDCPANAADIPSSFPSDRTNYLLLMEMMRQTEAPLFTLNVTIQNHGGYRDEELVFDPAADPWCHYLTLLHSSDAQLTEFLQALQNFEEPTVVVFFGDHWSYYDDTRLAQIGLDVNALTAEQQAAYRSTPYVVWSNCGYDFSQLPQQTSACYLGAQVLHQLGFELTPWQQFLVDGAARYPLYTYYLAPDNGTPAAWEEYVYQYQCLQYNALNDPVHYAFELFGHLSQ
ncbi:MAG: LTA synthase family protein [Faecalibacterium sp.]|nr:LTA synthase family protein [Faecalibacterium sp.]